jgi:hypothetical protein
MQSPRDVRCISGASVLALAAFLQLLRSNTLQERRAQRLYRTEVLQMATRVQSIFDEWLSRREVQPDNAQLANAAAVNRWELMRLLKAAEGLEPPRSLASVHRDVQNALVGSARACQLLANGYRVYKSEAVCDGQALLVETVADLNELVSQLELRV